MSGADTKLLTEAQFGVLLYDTSAGCAQRDAVVAYRNVLYALAQARAEVDAAKREYALGVEVHETVIAELRAEVERLTRESARIEAESRSDKALINRITRICDECPEESACEACEGSGVVPIDERAWTFGAAEKDRADKAEAERDEALARADAAEAETVRRIVGWMRVAPLCGPTETSYAAAIERGDWKGSKT